MFGDEAAIRREEQRGAVERAEGALDDADDDVEIELGGPGGEGFRLRAGAVDGGAAVAEELVAAFAGAVADGGAEGQAFRIAADQRLRKDEQMRAGSGSLAAVRLHFAQCGGRVKERAAELCEGGPKHGFMLQAGLRSLKMLYTPIDPEFSAPEVSKLMSASHRRCPRIVRTVLFLAAVLGCVCMLAFPAVIPAQSVPPALVSPPAGPPQTGPNGEKLIGMPRFHDPAPFDFDEHTGYTQIFDGKTLTGWDADPTIWRVENGLMIGETLEGHPRGNNYIVYRGASARDFDLKLEMKIEKGGGGGIQYRSVTGQPWTRPQPAGQPPYDLQFHDDRARRPTSGFR